MQDLGDRMKAYENVHRHYLVRRVPVIIRVDGRAFHTFTKNCKRPFDKNLIETMWRTAVAAASRMQGCRLVYIQSDEASFFLADWDTVTTEAWFGYNLSKLVSISAATFAVHFNQLWGGYSDFQHELATFDARAFQVPREEVANYFLWRAKDWERNSLQMYCQSLFSHKQLQGKGKADMHEMLHERGLNWTKDLLPVERNGTWIWRDGRETIVNHNILPRYDSVAQVVYEVMPKEEE
jgi:tRNA(His) guanylyltransferase